MDHAPITAVDRVRIIAGEWRGRRLATPADQRIRPTSDRVRENLFNLLNNHVEWQGLRVADLCAGTGALGLEALSRGAAHCAFVDKDRDARQLIETNVRTLGAQARAQIIVADVHKLLRADAPYDLILCDPPYKDDVCAMLAALITQGWTKEGTLLALEQAAGAAVDLSGWQHLDTRRYGKTIVVLREAGSVSDSRQ